MNMMNCEGFGRKQSLTNRGTSRCLPAVDEETYEKPHRVPGKIQIMSVLEECFV
jgi:hypothetical protein